MSSLNRFAARLYSPAVLTASAVCLALVAPSARGQDPTVNDPNLAVRAVVSGLTQPIGMAFLEPDAFLVTEKTTGRVKHVVQGQVKGIALDLPVNSASERGLLGIALHPDFKRNQWVYLFWSESSTGADTNAAADVPLLGNRVDRFVWDKQAETLTFDRNIIRLRALQPDANQPVRGNHNGGVIRFDNSGDKKISDRTTRLYVVVGDTGRRGMMQNLLRGPFGDDTPDDQFGGPEPDNAHLTGVVLRLMDNGTAPSDNPFYAYGATIGGEEGANLQKVFAYGIRNSFGLAVDPWTGEIWESENCDDAFDEINRIEPGHNGGWIQAMGPLARVTQFKQIETTFPTPPGALQQLRWPPSNIADDPITARSRMVDLPGSHYADPLFSWKWAVPPAAIGFMTDDSLGKEHEGALFVGSAVPVAAGGFLFRFTLTPNRRHIAWSDPRLADLVADNTAKFDMTESESILFGQNFGTGVDIHTGPNGNLYVVSASKGAVYEIYRVNK